eukprot:NODE_3188_length_2077_cov_8.122051.p1 GENE.NODE_3188_length_2077_cov_8.122051~~NODE_3188_length_2077_cov_8.122051.p1  ORF type:complete len:385 (-),score=90.12 NODE_3188_length_2077_cov_8.122051:242-1396(-)
MQLSRRGGDEECVQHRCRNHSVAYHARAAAAPRAAHLAHDEFFHELRSMVTGIRGSLPQLLWCLVLLLLFMYAVGTLHMQLLHEELVSPNTPWLRFINERFGTLFRTIYTLFIAIAGGADWADTCDPLLEINTAVGIFFIVYVAFVQFCILNVLIGLFVEKTASCMQLDKEYMQIEDAEARSIQIHGLASMFADADANLDGTISLDEFRTYADDHMVQAYLRSIGLDLDVVSVDSLFRLLDRERKGSIDLTDFIEGLAGVCGPARQLELTRMDQKLNQVLRAMHSLSESFRGLESPASVNRGVTQADRKPRNMAPHGSASAAATDFGAMPGTIGSAIGGQTNEQPPHANDGSVVGNGSGLWSLAKVSKMLCEPQREPDNALGLC